MRRGAEGERRAADQGMKRIANRKWKVRDRALGARVKAWLLVHGGAEEKVTGAYELWRLRQGDATWTYYTTGTLFVTETSHEAVAESERQVDGLVGGRFVAPSREFLIGLDETGKGEIFGPVVLAGVVVPRGLFQAIEELIGVADTKASRPARYWETLFARIEALRAERLDWTIRRIEPEEFDRVSINRLLDRDYGRIVEELASRVEMKRARVVLDDYGAGHALVEQLRRLGAAGAEMVKTTKADDRYLECRMASFVAKREQQRALETIRADARYRLEGRELGSGNAGDAKTLGWLRAWKDTGREWPAFVKRSFRTVREIDGKPPVTKRRTVEE